MPEIKDMAGRVFGRLIVLDRVGMRRTGALWRCLCECGSETTVQGTNLRNGHTTSCGHREVVPVERRFWAKVAKGPDCWEWSGSRTPKGYGLLNVDGVCQYAHRISYSLQNGDPGEMYVLHRCDNPRCVNPEHLFLGTHQDNMIDMASKDRWGNQTRKGVRDAISA